MSRIADKIARAIFWPNHHRVPTSIDFRTLEIYYTIRSWLEQFDEVLGKNQWKRAANHLCMLGVAETSFCANGDADPVLAWLASNQDAYNELAKEILAGHPGAAKYLTGYVAADLRAMEAGEEPEIFAIEAHARWVLAWLSQ